MDSNQKVVGALVDPSQEWNVAFFAEQDGKPSSLLKSAKAIALARFGKLFSPADLMGMKKKIFVQEVARARAAKLDS